VCFSQILEECDIIMKAIAGMDNFWFGLAWEQQCKNQKQNVHTM
jgi:hypothetical protein